MQHAQLIAGIKRVTEALEQCRLREALNPRDDLPPEMLLDALRRYSIAAARYTRSEEVVADLLGLTPLENTSVWARLLGDDDERMRLFDRVGFVTHHLPRFVELLEESSQAKHQSRSICVCAVGDGAEGLSTMRLVTIVKSLEALYAICRTVEELGPDEMSLSSIDAGDDTLLWFEADPVGLGYLKQLLIGAFRWLALYRERELEERLRSAKDNLPTIKRLKEQVESGSLAEDEARELEQEILVALLAFFDAGALIPEMEEDIQQSPRDIVTPPPPSARKRSHPSLEAMEAVADEINDLPEIGHTVPPTPGSEAELELERPSTYDRESDYPVGGAVDESELLLDEGAPDLEVGEADLDESLLRALDGEFVDESFVDESLVEDVDEPPSDPHAVDAG